jgi:hypothetical protein
MLEATIADLANIRRLSREPNEVGTEDCLSTGIAFVRCRVMAKTLNCAMCKIAQFCRAEKDGEGIALKICTEAKSFLKA